MLERLPDDVYSYPWLNFSPRAVMGSCDLALVIEPASSLAPNLVGRYKIGSLVVILYTDA